MDARAHFESLPDGGAVLFGALAAAARPVDELTISEWADRYRIVSGESGSPWPGPFRTDRVPYLREPQDCLHPDHSARRVTARWAAQLGKSTAIENWFGYIVDKAPGSMMIVLPTLEEATKFNRVKLQPTIDASPRINHKVKPVSSRDERGSTTSYKRFAGGYAQVVNAGSSKGLQMVSIKYLAMDEVTGYPADVDGRGSPRDQARARQKMYGDLAKEWQGSTPGYAGECAITADFEAGDQRFYYVPCPHCRTFQVLTFAQMRSESEAGPAHIVCLGCEGKILDGHKADLLAGGVWIACRVDEGEESVPEAMSAEEIERWRCDPCEGRCRNWQPSYHLWAAYAPREKFAEIMARHADALNDAAKMRVFSQQDLAEPYDPGGLLLDWEKVVEAATARPFESRMVPQEAGLLVAAADVQGYAIKMIVMAIGPRGQRWIIDAKVFEGEPDRSDEPWIALADALQERYPTCGEETLGIEFAGVDSGFATDRVYRFCAGRANVVPLDGRHKPGLAWLGTPVKREVKDRFDRKIADVMLYPVGNYDVKTEVVGGIANRIAGPSEETGTWPRNTLHVAPSICNEDFARELTAERLVDPEESIQTSVGRKARLISPQKAREWKKLPGRKNDWFDCAVYATAIGWHLERRKRLTLERWGDLLITVHGRLPGVEDLFSVAEESPFEKSRSRVAAQSGDATPSRSERPSRRGRWNTYQ